MADSRLYPSRPFLGVSALIRHDGKIVLVQRARPPLAGLWSLPGGAVETGEQLQDAIKREVREETGLAFEPTRLADLVEVIRWDSEQRCERHFVIAVFFGDLTGPQAPELIAGDDAGKAIWVPLSSLDDYTLTEGTPCVIERILAGSRLPSSV